jgi:cytochrome c
MTKRNTLIAALSGALLMAACGNSGETKSAEKKDSSTSPSTTSSSPASTAASDKGLELIGSSDCTTCHRLHEAEPAPTIGPSYEKVATKYSPAADTTINRIVSKIISGGSGVWGTTPMTAHPALKSEDVKTMVEYIMTLKK